MRTICVLCVLGISFLFSHAAAEGDVAKSYTIPAPHHVDLQGVVKCTAASSVVLREGEFLEDAGKGTLVAGVTQASTKLELKWTNKKLMVTEKAKSMEGYVVLNEKEAFLDAVFADPRAPVVKSIVIDKERGYASRTVQDRMNSETQFFVCE